MKIKILEFIKKELKKMEEERIEREKQRKEDVIDLITRKWDDSDLSTYNATFMIETNFWVAPLTEKEAKTRILLFNRNLFDEIEYNTLVEAIDNQQKELKR